MKDEDKYKLLVISIVLTITSLTVVWLQSLLKR